MQLIPIPVNKGDAEKRMREEGGGAGGTRRGKEVIQKFGSWGGSSGGCVRSEQLSLWRFVTKQQRKVERQKNGTEA